MVNDVVYQEAKALVQSSTERSPPFAKKIDSTSTLRLRKEELLEQQLERHPNCSKSVADGEYEENESNTKSVGIRPSDAMTGHIMV